MGWTYHTQYRLGRRAGRVCRTYEGPQAVVAITIDLMLSLLFGLIGFVVRLAWNISLAAVQFVVELLKLPVRTLRQIVHRSGYRPESKPATWAMAREL